MNEESVFGWASSQFVLERAFPGTTRQQTTLDEAVREVFVVWRDPVYRYLLAVAGSPRDAEDLTQETFIRLFQDAKKGNRINNLRSWLFRVAHNLSVDWYRKSSRVEEADQPGLDELAARHEDPSPGVEQKLLERERAERMLSRLSPQERRCMELRTEGLCYREIGEVLGIKIPTVQTVLGRAVRKLSDGNHE